MASRLAAGLCSVLALGCGTHHSAPQHVDAAVAHAHDAAPDARMERMEPLPEFDLGRDFSFTQNPNGPWRYGYGTMTQMSVQDVRLDMAPIDAGPMTIWHPSTEAGAYYPYIAKSHADISIMDATSSWALRPDQVALEASATGQLSVIQFIAPSSGNYEISATFEGVHFRLSSTDVHVQHNDETLFSADIDGYAGDTAFAAEHGEHPRAIYMDRLALQAGDSLSFAVGTGPNHTNTNDTTGLTLHIRQLP